MTVTVREMQPGEERLFLELHQRSVRGLAAGHYPPHVIEAWVVPASGDHLKTFAANRDHEVRLIAELDGQPVGLGAIVVALSELRACYVVPEAARRGVGSALVREIERLAKLNGLQHLQLHASINAEPFYASLGYHATGRTEIVLRGQPMTAIRMRKRLDLN
jgi:putative acetyltransferase